MIGVFRIHRPAGSMLDCGADSAAHQQFGSSYNCHYTNGTAGVASISRKQLAGLADPARRPASLDLGITDEQLIQRRSAGSSSCNANAAAISPSFRRARPHAHHVGTEAVSQQWTRISNDLIHRIATLLPDNFGRRRPNASVPRRLAQIVCRSWTAWSMSSALSA